LMIVAKTEKGLAHFKKLFQDKSELAWLVSRSETIQEKESWTLKKFYRATCYLTEAGKKFLDGITMLPYYIKELVVAKIPHTEPKMWITKILNFKIENQKVNLELEILTWRTHQIRYHLAHHGLPIVGDYLYGKDDTDASVGPMWLTAWKLMFEDIDGKMVELHI
jgi:23S rRNA-/tRNA-specific pseudouridylate synthase